MPAFRAPHRRGLVRAQAAAAEAGAALVDAPVVAEIRSPSWDDGRPDELLRVAGKVENLRVARAAFHGAEIPAGGLMSFWRQLGGEHRT